jgi:hypothetical protein
MKAERSLADISAPPVPQINDGYWFAFSKTLVDGALKSRDDAAEKLQVFIGWLWSIYTLGTAIGINLGKLSLGLWPSVLIGSPIIALVCVYWLTIWVRTPALLQFDPRVPQDIARVYEHNLLQKQRRLSLTLMAAGLAAVLVAWALSYASMVSSPSAVPQVAAEINTDHGTTSLFVKGNVGDAQTALLTVSDNQRVFAQETIPTDKGAFRIEAIHLAPPLPKSVLVQVTANLKTGGSKILVSKEVALPGAPVKQ